MLMLYIPEIKQIGGVGGIENRTARLDHQFSGKVIAIGRIDNEIEITLNAFGFLVVKFCPPAIIQKFGSILLQCLENRLIGPLNFIRIYLQVALEFLSMRPGGCKE